MLSSRKYWESRRTAGGGLRVLRLWGGVLYRGICGSYNGNISVFIIHFFRLLFLECDGKMNTNKCSTTCYVRAMM